MVTSRLSKELDRNDNWQVVCFFDATRACFIKRCAWRGHCKQPVGPWGCFLLTQGVLFVSLLKTSTIRAHRLLCSLPPCQEEWLHMCFNEWLIDSLTSWVTENSSSLSVPGFNAPLPGGVASSSSSSGQNGRNSPTSNATGFGGDSNLPQAKPAFPPLPPRCKKPPPPPPPVNSGHVRNRSEPDASHLGHKRTGSEPPPRPSLSEFRHATSIPSGQS